MRSRSERPQTKSIILGGGPEPDRPGHRVRLLLRARGLRADRSRLRDHHGQLQPGNRFDRLRHLGPAVFRTADRRRRDRNLSHSRKRQRHLLGVIVQFGGQTPLKLAGALSGGHPDSRHVARRHRPRRRPRTVSGNCCRTSICASRPTPSRPPKKPKPSPRNRLSRRDPAVLRAGRSGHGNRARSCRADALHDRGRAVSGDNPVLLDGYLQDAIEIDVDALADGERCVRRRDHGTHRRSRHSFRRLGLFVAALFARRRRHRRTAARPETGRGLNVSA
jgi:hypothetical protein